MSVSFTATGKRVLADILAGKCKNPDIMYIEYARSIPRSDVVPSLEHFTNLAGRKTAGVLRVPISSIAVTDTNKIIFKAATQWVSTTLNPWAFRATIAVSDENGDRLVLSSALQPAIKMISNSMLIVTVELNLGV